MTDVTNRTTIVNTHQAGEEIYNLMDKVFQIDQGRMISSGPRYRSKTIFHWFRFRLPRATVCTPEAMFKAQVRTFDRTAADFLTTITDRIERQILNHQSHLQSVVIRVIQYHSSSKFSHVHPVSTGFIEGICRGSGLSSSSIGR